MDLDTLKGKTLDDATHTALVAYVSSLNTRAETAEGKARTATQESIAGRQKLKAERDAAMSKLGVDSIEEIEALPDARGQADAAKQTEAQLRRITRERDDAVKQRDDLAGRYSTERRQRAIAAEVAKHPFIDAEDVTALVDRRVKAEGDDLFFDGPDGRAVSVADGVAWIAKTKTHLVRASGEGGGGSGFKGAGGNAGTPNPFAKATFNLTEQIALRSANPAAAAAMEAAAA